MFVNWSPEKRQEIALSVLKGELDARLARALLDGWLEVVNAGLALDHPARDLSDDEWKGLERETQHVEDLLTRYELYCGILGVPKVVLYTPHPLYADKHYTLEYDGDFPLTDTGIQYLMDAAERCGCGDDPTHDIYSTETETHIYLHFKDYIGARQFAEELLHVLTSTVFRKAG